MNARVLLSCVFSLAGGCLPVATVLAQCPPHWSSGFALDGFDGTVICVTNASVDGVSPARAIIGGSFSNRGSTVSIFEAGAWRTLGNTSNLGTGWKLSSFDPDGAGPLPRTPVLVATSRGFSGLGVLLYNPASTAWVRLGAPTAFDAADVITTYDPDGDGPLPERLVVAGTTSNGTTSTAGLYELRDGAFVYVGDSPADVQIQALQAYDEDGPGPLLPRLLVGGSFNRGTQTIALRAWDGNAWTNLLGSADGVSNIQAMTIDTAAPGGNALVIGGGFSRIGSVAARNVARKVAGAWEPYGAGPPGAAFSMAFGDPDGTGPAPASLMVASFSSLTGGAPNVHWFDGASWNPAASGVSGTLWQIGLADPDGAGPLEPRLLAAGEFPGAGEVVATNLAAWDGRAWSALGSGVDLGAYRNPQVLRVIDEDGAGPGSPVLFAGGGFTSIGGVAAHGLAKFDGAAWAAEPGILAGTTYDLIEFDPDGPGPLPTSLAACGLALTPAGQASTGVAMRTNGVWNRLAAGPGTSGTPIYALASFDEDGDGPNPAHLYAAGSFNVLRGNVSFQNIGRWNGAAWEPVGGGLGGTVYAMTVFDEDGPGPIAPALYVAGAFSAAFGSPSVSTGAVAKWTGTAWQPTVATASNRPNSTVAHLFVHDFDGAGPGLAVLLASGNFTFDLSGQRYSNFARLEGGAWRPASTSTFPASPLSGNAGSMCAFDLDGAGPQPPALLLAGGFTFLPGQVIGLSTSQTIASYDRALQRWQQLPFNTPTGIPEAMASVGASLFASGRFSTVDGRSSHGMARYGPENDLGVLVQPGDASVRSGADVVLGARGVGGSAVLYQWRRGGEALSDSGGIAGAQTETLRIGGVSPADAGLYDCVISDACGSVTTRAARVDVRCAADLNGVDGLNADDLSDFLTCSFGVPACPDADFNRDGNVDPDDLAEFIAAYFGGCV